MAVLITFTLKTDVATYEAMHAMTTAPGNPPPPRPDPSRRLEESWKTGCCT
jgi:hypothetical protein